VKFSAGQPPRLRPARMPRRNPDRPPALLAGFQTSPPRPPIRTPPDLCPSLPPNPLHPQMTSAAEQSAHDVSATPSRAPSDHSPLTHLLFSVASVRFRAKLNRESVTIYTVEDLTTFEPSADFVMPVCGRTE
jgi:hypothetical protein